MATTVDGRFVSRWLMTSACQLADATELLTELDAARGDADHGVNMVRGFAAIAAALEDQPEVNAAAVLERASAVLRSSMGGASGALWAVAFRAAAAALGGAEAVTPVQLSTALAAAVAAISDFGGAREGDNTMLDSLLPGLRAMDSALDRGADIAGATDVAATAAMAGARATATRLARVGRAAQIGEDAGPNSADPGAMSAAIVMRALHEAAGAI